jgi:hypothetical protein
MPPSGRHQALLAIAGLAAAAAVALAADEPEWRRVRGRLNVLTAPTQVARLVAPLPGDCEELGRSIAVGPGIVVVGAPGNVTGDPSLYLAGAAHVFVGGGGTWRHRQQLVAFDRELGDSFGRSVAVDGDTIAVGAEHDDHADVANAGSVYVFVRSGSTWMLERKIVAPDPRAEAHFGHSLALDGDTLAVGAWATDTVYVFERTGAWWSEPQLVRALPGQGGSFGHSLALDGDRLVVGAERRWSPSAQVRAGGASVFELVGQEWVLEQDLAAVDPGHNDCFGESVAMAGDLIVVGASKDDDPLNEDSGSAYVFSRVAGEWTEAQKLVPGSASPWQRFGWSVGVAGGNLLVGSPWYSSESLRHTGCAYLFRPVGGSWQPSCLLTASAAAPSDRLGDIAISGHTAVLGARLADVGSCADAGAAYVFLLP